MVMTAEILFIIYKIGVCIYAGKRNIIQLLSSFLAEVSESWLFLSCREQL